MVDLIIKMVEPIKTLSGTDHVLISATKLVEVKDAISC